MPTNRRRRLVRRRPSVTTWQVDYLETGVRPRDHALAVLQVEADHLRGGHALEQLWRQLGPPLLTTWSRTHPGTRPFGWWLFEAPRRPAGGPHLPAWARDRAIDARRLVRGTGRPAPGLPPRLRLGAPIDLVDVDPVDPPQIESQAAYLARHGLLGEAERARLEDDAFAPEILAPAGEHRVDRYARDVAEGCVVAGRLVRLACERHLRDRALAASAGGHPAGFQFSEEWADNGFAFFEEVVRLPDADRPHEPDCPLAEHAREGTGYLDDLDCTCSWTEHGDEGQPFVLLDYQAFILGSLFGWRKAIGLRRFRYAYIEIGKGSGKTPMMGGLGLYGLVLDGEKKAEICAAAVTRDQAHILFDDAAGMVDASPQLRAVIDHAANELRYDKSWIRIVSSEHKGLDGKRPHMALIDELHEHGTPLVVNKLRAGGKRRKQPLFPEITNSGFDRTSVCWQHHEHARRVLEGIVEDDRLFAYVCMTDKGDDPFTDPSCWPKTNPGLAAGLPTREYLQDQVAQALNIPAERNTVARLNFCVWTTTLTRYFEAGAWGGCAAVVPDEDLVGAPCYAGLDLGQTDDLSARALIWCLEDGRVAVKMKYWIPEEALRRFRERPYDQWRRAGVSIVVTPGNATDYDIIQADLIADCRDAGVIELAYDKKFASQLANKCQEAGIAVVDQPQGYGLNEAIRKLTALVRNGLLCHGGDPLLWWMADNTVTREGRQKELRLDKERSTEKIDGVNALCNALQRAVLAKAPAPAPSYQMLIIGGRV